MEAKDQRQVAEGLVNGHGVLVYWKFSGTSITPDDLRSRLTTSGLADVAGLVKDIDRNKALKSAARTWTNQGASKNWRARTVGGSNDSMKNISLMEFEETVNGSDRNRGDFVQRDMTVYNTDTESFDTGLMGAGQIGESEAAREFMAYAVHKMTHLDGNYIREKIVYPLFEDAVQVGGGGTFYLPNDSSNLDTIKSLQPVLKPIGFVLYVCDIQAGPGWNEAIADSTVEMINGRLEKLSGQIDGWEESTRQVRSDAEETALRNFMSLNKMAQHVEDNLGRQLEELKDRINNMKTRASEIVDGKRTVVAQARKRAVVLSPNIEAIAMWPRMKIEAVWSALIEENVCPDDNIEAAKGIATAMG